MPTPSDSGEAEETAEDRFAELRKTPVEKWPDKEMRAFLRKHDFTLTEVKAMSKTHRRALIRQILKEG